MHSTISLENQLLATKFYAPIASGPLVTRPRLNALLNESLKHPLTLVSAPAGFGKTTVLSTWVRSQQSSQCLMAWLSLDKEDNDPQLFWTYVLAALERQHPERFGPLFKSLQSSQVPPLKSLLTALINLLLENDQHVLLILDDYHLITTPDIHTTISYLVKHIPPQLHLILATRSDPPLQLAQWRVREQILEVRTQQLCCTTEETRDFFQVVRGIQLPEETIATMTAQTEGWLVGLQLLGLSLPEQADPLALLEEIRGDQRYILDYLMEEVLRQQPPEVQTFLLSTCVLEQLTASLCDAITGQGNSQQILERLERANLFLTSLDSKRQWYRYHALFAEALHSQLEQTHGNLLPMLHARASRWYAQQHQTTQAILHAFKARDWNWAADLIEQAYLPLISFAWGANKHALVQLRQWVEQLPAEILACRPRFCLSCFQMLWIVTPQPLLYNWLDLAEAAVTTLLRTQTSADGSQPLLAPEAQQELENLLGEVLTNRAFSLCNTEEGHLALALCEQALTLLSAENAIARTFVALIQLTAYYASSANDMLAAVKYGHQAILLSREVGEPAYTISIMGLSALYTIGGTGRLYEVKRLTEQAIQLGTLPTGSKLPDVGILAVLQAEVLCEWNELDAARSLATEGISLYEQASSLLSLFFWLGGKPVLTAGIGLKEAGGKEARQEEESSPRSKKMARRSPRPEATQEKALIPLKESCEHCGQPLWVARHNHRTVTTLSGVWKLTLVVRQCIEPSCPRFHQRLHPEEEGSWALPHGEFGLEVIALIGQWRYSEHRSVPEMHQMLVARGISIAQRSVTQLMQRYEELVALQITDHERIKAQLQKQGQVILAIDGLQPDVGHEVLWVVRDCLSKEILLARPLLSSTQGDLTALLTQVKDQLQELEVPVKGIISDGEETLGSAIAFVFPKAPHQLCQFHYLKDAIDPLYEADRHAKTQLKKQLRGVRPMERALEQQKTPENQAIRGYCLAVRASLTDDGRSPLQPSGLKLFDRITQIYDSIARVQEKKSWHPY